MTEGPMPGPDEPATHVDQAAYSPAAPPNIPPPESPRPADAPPPASSAGKAGPVIIIGVIVAFLAIVLFVVRNNVAADDLKVGECFNTTAQSTVQTVERHPCTESHNAEVIFVGEYSGDKYPISLSLDRFIEESCVPAFETYVGRAIDTDPALSIGYFYPSRDTWDKGDKTITCYVSQPDDSPMTQSLKG